MSVRAVHQHQHTLTIQTRGAGLIEFTGDVASVVADARVTTGLVHLFCQHTSCSLLIQENADPDVQHDLSAFFKRLVPDGDALLVHRSEGPDDMPAHIKTALTQTALTVPINAGRMMLGTWQGIYLFEHRQAPHLRSIVIHVIGN